MKKNILALVLVSFSFSVVYAFDFENDLEFNNGSSALNIPSPNRLIDKSVSSKVSSSSVTDGEGFDSSLPKTPPPDTVLYRVMSDEENVSKGGIADADDFDIASIDDIKYFDIVTKAAEEQGFDRELVLAIIMKESRFNAKTKSAVGAVGLMQLMPDTARWLGLKNTSKLTDPETNVRYGIKYMRYLFSEISPDVDYSNLSKEDVSRQEIIKSIAAYNCGPGNVKKYDKHPYNGIPPFKETKNYVKKVPLYFIHFEDLLSSK
jgi:hypothetical protein